MSPPVLRFVPPLELVLPLKKCPFFKKLLFFFCDTQRNTTPCNKKQDIITKRYMIWSKFALLNKFAPQWTFLKKGPAPIS